MYQLICSPKKKDYKIIEKNKFLPRGYIKIAVSGMYLTTLTTIITIKEIVL